MLTITLTELNPCDKVRLLNKLFKHIQRMTSMQIRINAIKLELAAYKFNCIVMLCNSRIILNVVILTIQLVTVFYIIIFIMQNTI